MKSLTELRDELVKNVVKYEGTKKFDYYNEALAKLAGFDAALKAQAEQSSSAEFDLRKSKIAAEIFAPLFESESLSEYTLTGDRLSFRSRDDFIEGARWQHQQNSAALSAMKSELVVRNAVVIKQGDEIDKLRAENEWVKGNISGHIGAVDIFCERNDNLLAENAILREGLNFYADVDNWENPCVINDPDLKAQKALTAADKVRSGG